MGGEVEKIDVPAEWANIALKPESDDPGKSDFVKKIFDPVSQMKGDDIPVSAFLGREDGTFPAGTSALEKRGIAVNVPVWLPQNCTQCNQCAYVCPHAVIRPFLLNEEEKKNSPEDMVTLKAVGKELTGLEFRLQVSVLDCTGCGNCLDVCPAKIKALEMSPLGLQMGETKNWDFVIKNITYKPDVAPPSRTFKNSQFVQPLFEFSGACGGCGETSYIKLITQLFGDRMMIANATGCSSIYGGTAPFIPYTVNNKGHGPAWANSLFEDNAEYGFGMVTGISVLRKRIAQKMKVAIKENHLSLVTLDAFKEWIDGKDDAEKSKSATEKLLPLLEKEHDGLAKELLDLKQYLVKKSVWVIGGDGWAYDIGYGGLDHVLASGEDINVLVLDTEVYSNTGGQSSKATPAGAVAKFAASGKKVGKKDLGAMAMTYGYVYVAQVAMGANNGQLFRAIKEAEAYPGPSMIIAYSPCINHGIRLGMGTTQQEEDRAVKSGYWQLYRYNPLQMKEGKNPFILDSKEPDWTKFQEFLDSEIRYTSLAKMFPAEAEILFKTAAENAKNRWLNYKRMAEMDFSR